MKKDILKVALFSIIFLLIFNFKVYAANKVIVLDPGHGGIDSGATNSSKGIIERDVNLKIAKYLTYWKLYFKLVINIVWNDKYIKKNIKKIVKNVYKKDSFVV